ncbi:hypothetical protein [Escherichia coli]|uniref:hypothetical protein n=1 Tax=Escherichia coli TaxID=562 RepID=UPI002FCD43CE
MPSFKQSTNQTDLPKPLISAPFFLPPLSIDSGRLLPHEYLPPPSHQYTVAETVAIVFTACSHPPIALTTLINLLPTFFTTGPTISQLSIMRYAPRQEAQLIPLLAAYSSRYP